MERFETIILGGGASGVMCALSCQCQSVAIIDANAKLAKKLLVTGNGKCNITNVDIDEQPSVNFYNQNIDNFFKKRNSQQTLNFFKSKGLEFVVDDEFRVYPISKSAVSVQDVIIREIEKKQVKTFLEEKVLSVKKVKDDFIIQTDKNMFMCKKLVFCLGGNQNEMLKGFDLEIKQNAPSLCAIRTTNTKNLSGKRLENVLVSAYDSKGNLKKQEKGEVLFKDDGLSGIVIFNMSSVFARKNEYSGKVVIDLLPDYSYEEILNMLKKRRELNVPVSQFFVGLFINQIAYLLFELSKTQENKQSTALSDEEIELLVKNIKSLSFEVNGFYDNNQVFSGGIELKSLDENLQAKNVKGLYICGEACDVDGLCGGYNLQWAWTSGYIAGSVL